MAFVGLLGVYENMPKLWEMLSTAFVFVFSCMLMAQGNPPAAPVQDRSFYQGALAMNPEGLSGIWEAPDGKGGAVGIHLVLNTTVPAEAKTLDGIPQSWQSLELGVYERQSAELQMNEQNYFSDSLRGGGVRFEHGRLTLHFVSGWRDAPSIDIDLTQQPGDRWAGRFHRGDFDAQVVLRRPSVLGGGRNSIVGTWREDSRGFYSCLHIVEQAPNQFAGWSDSLKALGSIMIAPNVVKPHSAFEHYGELMKVRRMDDGRYSIELYAYTATCCSHTVFGKFNADGSVLEGTWPPGANQAPHASTWRRVQGDSCTGLGPSR